MWTFTPTFAITIAFLSWVVFCWLRIWFYTPQWTRRSFIASACVLVAHRIFFTCYAFAGLFLLDIVARLCFSNLVSYGSLSYLAAPALLCALPGALYLFRTTLLAPTPKELLGFAGMFVTYLYVSMAAPIPDLRAALFTGLSLMLLFTAADIGKGALQWKRKGADEKAKEAEDAADNGMPDLKTESSRVLVSPIWDLSHKFRAFSGAKLYFVVLLLLSAEFLLQLEGRSLLCWL